MRIEDITATVRPRSGYEAADLGVLMVGAWFKPLMTAWMVCVWPLQLLILAILWNHPKWAITLIWFIKPLNDRIPLHVISRKLFGVEPRLRDLIKQLPHLYFTRIIPALTIWRFSPRRTYLMPVHMLENLKGNLFTRRCNVLNRYLGNQSGGITFACSLVESALMIGLIGFVMFLIPDNSRINLLQEIQTLGDGELYLGSAALFRVLTGLYILVLTYTETLYVSAGFAMYLNSRTHLEGWDIELKFREINNRIASIGKKATAGLAERVTKGVALLCLSLGLWASSSLTPVQAQTGAKGPESAKEIAQRINKLEDFKIHERTSTSFRLKPRSSKPRPQRRSGASLNMLGQLVEMLVIGILVMFLIWLIILGVRNYRQNGLRQVNSKGEVEAPPDELMGMDIRKKSLPKDLVAVARDLWNAGNTDQAIALLYRGSLSALVHQHELGVRDSDTEHDVLRRVRKSDAKDRLGYLRELTRTWINRAYGKKECSPEQFDALCQDWPFVKTSKRSKSVLKSNSEDSA